MSFSDLGLSEALLRAVREQGYTNPTDVQAKAIPTILEGRDVLAGAQTGTGKTAGFTLPLLQRLSDSGFYEEPPASVRKKKRRPVRALILTPTRELASQVSDSVETYGKHLPLRSNVVFGGVKISPQIFKLRRGVDILVATPGRLLDLVNQRVVDLSKIEILVLDEADRMLDMGFLPSIKKVIALTPKDRQTLLFSATYSTKISQLASSMLNNPVSIEVAKRNTVSETISHIVHPVERDQKRALLSFLIGSNDWNQVLVFTKTKIGAERLSKQLRADGLRSTAIHGNKTQGARKKALEEFKENRVRVLVATDVAARGLDIHHLSHVVNFELPLVAEDYIHRIGRTGRAGNKGVAISLMGADEKNLLRDIEQLLKCDVKKEIVEGYEPSFSLTTPSKPAGKSRHGRGKPGGSGRPSNPSNRKRQGKNGESKWGKKPGAKSGNRSNGNRDANGNRAEDSRKSNDRGSRGSDTANNNSKPSYAKRRNKPSRPQAARS